ncbi:MAG: hypothetical protein JXA82_00215 [Sedimentisphaerales bacterium]|nr:hypothetical protein [Sedimentisphaerales bacterium]
MSNMIRMCFCFCFLLSLMESTPCFGKSVPRIGESEKVYTLAGDNQEIRGLAFDDISPKAPRLFILDRSGKIFVYRLHQNPGEEIDELILLDTLSLPKNSEESSLASPRGLSFALDKEQEILFFLNWDASSSQLWCCNFKNQNYTHVDLTEYLYHIGHREVVDLAYDEGNLFICFDASGYKNGNLRVQRGIIQLKWNQAQKEPFEFIKHLPDSGEFPSRGIAYMKFEGARYLWATAGNDSIYSADARTGRGLFYFDRPTSTDLSRNGWGLTFGQGDLWVPESVSGADRVHRVNVTKNLGTYYEGPRILRHLTMTIQSQPETDAENPGMVYHYYSRPYSYEQLHNQGVWPDTEKIADLTVAPNATIKTFTYDPAKDKSSRQYMALVEYSDATAQTYLSQYEIDLWTNPYRKYVYPHRVNKNVDKLTGTNYLADDPVLFNLNDTKTYDDFFKRIEKHIEDKYGVPADMDNPYWAARNALEYIQDHYYYPSRDQGRPATVDYAREHYDANPANLKIALSAKDYDKTQIIACSGTSVMLAGAMRYIEHPARWLGTGTEKGSSLWDKNENGLLDKGESAPCSSGHRYTQVWLGDFYGWICFDATPTKPDVVDYDPAPPIQSQWRYMNRAARGHLLDKRIVFNVGSGLFRPLYRDFEYDEKLAKDNNCGGDQRYNLQGRYEKPELWKSPRHRISVGNVCFIKDITLSGPRNKTQVTWKLEGHWHKDPSATLSLYLQRIADGSTRARDIIRLVKGIPYDASNALVDLSGYSGKGYRLILRKEGDLETGGYSEIFDLE